MHKPTAASSTPSSLWATSAACAKGTKQICGLQRSTKLHMPTSAASAIWAALVTEMATTRSRMVITHCSADKTSAPFPIAVQRGQIAASLIVDPITHAASLSPETVTQSQSAASSLMPACSTAHIHCSITHTIILWQPAQLVG